jgi:hypothetical protein
LAQLPRESGKNGQIQRKIIKNVGISLKPATVFRHIYMPKRKCCRSLVIGTHENGWSLIAVLPAALLGCSTFDFFPTLRSPTAGLWSLTSGLCFQHVSLSAFCSPLHAIPQILAACRPLQTDTSGLARPSGRASACAARRRDEPLATGQPLLQPPKVSLNILPHPGLLPKEKEKRSPRPWNNRALDWSASHPRQRKA